MTDRAAPDKLPLRDLDKQVVSVTPVRTPGSIGTGSKVTLHFSLALANEQAGDAAEFLIDSNFETAPVSFVVGDGNMLPGFEQELLGKRAGDHVEAVIPADKAFGPVNPDNQQRFPRYTFPPDVALSENLLIEFADASGYKQAGRITQIGTHDVEIDFNHPLAGRAIRFTAAIHQVEDSLDGNGKQ